MKDFEKTLCLICGADDFFPYSTKGQFGITTNVVICKNCGFSYLNPRWTKKRYHFFYSKEYDSYYRPEVIGKSYQYDPAKSIKSIIKRAGSLINFTSGSLNILDIGTGMGDSLVYLKNEISRNSHYFAIESSEHCQLHLKNNGIGLLTNDVDSDWHLGNEQKFDFVIMRHVLEHFLDPLTVLKKAHSVLKPDGILYIAVPNAKKPTKPLLGHFFRVVHVSYFSTKSLQNLFSSAGFTPLMMQEGDAMERLEIYTFSSKTVPSSFTPDENEWKVQKAIYDKYRKKELFYRLKDLIAKKIILRFR